MKFNQEYTAIRFPAAHHLGTSRFVKLQSRGYPVVVCVVYDFDGLRQDFTHPT